MKKLHYVVLAVLAVVIGVGVLFFNKNEATRTPKPGIYFLLQNSFYAIVPVEEVNITLDFYEVSKDNHSENYIDKCSDFSLVSDVGEEYPINVNKDDIYDENRNIKISDSMTVRKYRMNISTILNEKIKIVSVRFKNEKNKFISQDIGCIEFYISTDSQGDLSFSSNRIDWESFVQPTFDHAELIVSNEEKQDIKITNLLYGDTGIKTNEDTMFEVKAGEDKSIDISVDLVNETEGEPIVYYLKPIVRYMCNNDRKETVCNNIYRETYYGTSKEIREYLYKKSRESEK